MTPTMNISYNNNKAMEESPEQGYDSPVVVPREQSNVERGLNTQFLVVLNAFRAKQASKNDEDFGMDYPLDLHYLW